MLMQALAKLTTVEVDGCCINRCTFRERVGIFKWRLVVFTCTNADLHVKYFVITEKIPGYRAIQVLVSHTEHCNYMLGATDHQDITVIIGCIMFPHV